MKSEIFASAINNRNRVKFLYNLNEVVIDPYYITLNKCGNKVIFGRVNKSSEVKMFEYTKIFNLKVLRRDNFSPLIPVLPIAN